MPVAAHCPVPRLQVKDARSKIQKLFAKAAQSQSQLISCAALPPPLHRRPPRLLALCCTRG